MSHRETEPSTGLEEHLMSPSYSHRCQAGEGHGGRQKDWISGARQQPQPPIPAAPALGQLQSRSGLHYLVVPHGQHASWSVLFSAPSCSRKVWTHAPRLAAWHKARAGGLSQTGLRTTQCLSASGCGSVSKVKEPNTIRWIPHAIFRGCPLLVDGPEALVFLAHFVLCSPKL